MRPGATMQAYQSPPCAYCGVTWNPPGSQACGNCRNPLMAPPAYAPPGYPTAAYPSPGYPQQGSYPAPPAGYQPGAPYGQPQPQLQFQPEQFPVYAAAAPSVPPAVRKAFSMRLFMGSLFF